MIKLEDLIIKEEALERLNNPTVVSDWLEAEKPLQELFGFSNEALEEFYDLAKGILEKEKFPEAIKAFSFLTILNPFIMDFWLGLGMAQQKNKNFNEAIRSFEMAYNLEENNVLPYSLSAECYIELNDYDKADEVLKQAENYTREHPDDEKCSEMKKAIENGMKMLKKKKR